MSDHPQNPDDPIFKPLERTTPTAATSTWSRRSWSADQHHRRPTTGDPYDLGWLFVRWSWEAGYRSWNDGPRALARALRGLEEVGFIERRRIRRAGHDTHHGFVLTEDGREAVNALSGDWVKEVDG